MPTLSVTAPDHFAADLDRLNQALQVAGAVLPPAPDGFAGLDPTVLPQVQETYSRLCSFGWANGWLVP